MNEKQINKWLRKRFSPVGWTLVGYYVLMNILVSVAMLRDVIAGYLNAFIEGNDQYVPDVSALTGNAWGYIAAVAVALVILYAWKGSCLLYTSFRIGRSLAAQYVSAGKAAIDGLPCEKPDKSVPEGAKISVRGLGKIKLAAINGRTKKDRISVVIHRYV